MCQKSNSITSVLYMFIYSVAYIYIVVVITVVSSFILNSCKSKLKLYIMVLNDIY